MPSGSLAQAFPPELFEAIIDFLHNDIPSLCACGLVCCPWNAFSRVHLFATVDLGWHQADRILRLKVVSTDGSTIPRNIRRLNITNHHVNDWTNTIFDELPPLPAIRTLLVQVAYWRKLSSRVKDNMAQIFQSLTELSLYSINVPPWVLGHTRYSDT
ncbi:hypothetical protein M422DRAFT_274363 [Sphaerobolus stellatus SS14]|uniref:F-box domain-containing protein n=1 Tax=Sphaerobolus stellatus (strain SS14) TaxID=990650 RepID=A0A0C9TSB4_SPHS4|nr:hypothetical protein M422DRAFT_274363 [Sphaerobolus stellatus SS14]